MINVGETRYDIFKRVNEPESSGDGGSAGDGAAVGGGANDAQVPRTFDALLAQGLRGRAADVPVAVAEPVFVEAGEGGVNGGGARASRDGGAGEREGDREQGVDGGGGRVGARPDVDDVAARELATATPRGPDPLGLTSAVAKEATSAGGNASGSAGERGAEAGAERQSGRRPARADEAKTSERGAGAGLGRGEGQHESRADAARGGGVSASAPAAGEVREGGAAGANAARASATRATSVGAVGAVGGVSGANGGKGAAGGESGAVPMPRGAVGQPENGRAWSVKSAGGGEKAAATAKPHEPVALQTSRAIAAAMKVDGDGVVSLKLAPDALGELRIQLHMKGERVSASIEAQSAEARDLLRQTSDVLRMALEARGLSVDRIDVTLKEPAAESSAGGWAGPGDQRHSAADSNGGSGSAFDAGHADGDRRGSRESAAHGGAGRMVSVGTEADADGAGEVRVVHDAGGWMTLGVDALA